MAENNGLTWDQTGIGEEVITPDAASAADTGGILPIGKYQCVCAKSTPITKNFTKAGYSCVAAHLEFDITKPLEINGKVPSPEEARAYIGRSIWDDVCMQHPREKDGMKNRRILVAKRLGLIGSNGGIIPSDAWQNKVVGCSVILTIEHEKDSVTGKTYQRVPFAGYEAVGSAQATSAAAAKAPTEKVDQYADI